MPHGALYYGDPINRAHPLNRGLVSEWAVVPWYKSGPRWIDLCGRNHGTLTNGPTWAGANGRPGGYGAVSLDGVDDYVAGFTMGATGVWNPDPYAISLWFFDKGGTGSIFDLDNDTNLFSLNTFGGDLFISRGGRGIDSLLKGSYGTSSWHHLVITASSALGIFSTSFDGAPAADVGFGSMGWGAGAVPVKLGVWNNGTSRPFNGYLDGICFYSGRYLAAADRAALYDQSRRGNPDRWRWLSTRYYAPPAAADTLFAQICC